MNHNRRRLRFDVFGKLLSFPEIAELAGISEGTVRQRITAGWTIEEILKTPTTPLLARLEIGAQFDDRIIMEYGPSGTSGDRRVICRCVCGKLVIIREIDLRNGRRTRCVCKKHKVLVAGAQLPGSGAVVIELIFAIPGRTGLSSQVWKCQCPCGKMFKENGRELIEGHRVWCGLKCPKKRAHKQDVMRKVRERYVTKIDVGGLLLTTKEIAANTDVGPDAVRRRAKVGMSIERIIGPRMRTRPKII